MKKDRSELEVNLAQVLTQIKFNNKTVAKIKDELLKNKITFAESEKWILGETPLNEITDLEKLCLLTMATYLHTLNQAQVDSSSIDPKLFFNDMDIRNAEVYKEIKQVKTLEFPYTFKGKFIKIKEGHWLGSSSAQELNEMNSSGLVFYNYRCQRAANERTSKEDPNVMIKTPKISQGNIKEMAKLMKTGRLESTELVFNAREGTSSEGEELLYDEESMKLTITESTFFDIIDGFNRLSMVSQVLSESEFKDLDMNFEVRILNVDESAAIQHFSQINKGLVHSKSSLEQKDTNEIYSTITNKVQEKCEVLRDKISLSERIPQNSNLLVSFHVLKDAISESFDVEENNIVESRKVQKFLVEFFDELFMSYPEAFLTNIAEVRKESLINSNMMFYGFCILAHKFYTENINVDKISKYIDQIDFSRKNPMWHEISVLDKNLNVTSNPKKRIQELFRNIDVKVRAI